MIRLIDLLWPRACEVCRRPVDRPGRQLCAECLMRVPFVPTAGCCRLCGRAAEGVDGDYLCEDCTGPHRPHFEAAASAVRFEGKVRELLLDFKFNGRLWLRDDFVDWLEAAARARFELAQVDCVIPIPLTRFHRIDRGYDQCAVLAAALAKRIDRGCRTDLLRRIGSPERQAELAEEERRANVLGTFAVRKPEWVRARTVLLVDDIMTTGSTLSEAARTLKAAGAARVWCVTLARSIRG